MTFKLNCKHCDRYLMTITKSTVIEEMPCSSCKSKSNYKVVFSSDYNQEVVRHKFKAMETEPKKKKEQTNG